MIKKESFLLLRTGLKPLGMTFATCSYDMESAVSSRSPCWLTFRGNRGIPFNKIWVVDGVLCVMLL